LGRTKLRTRGYSAAVRRSWLASGCRRIGIDALTAWDVEVEPVPQLDRTRRDNDSVCKKRRTASTQLAIIQQEFREVQSSLGSCRISRILCNETLQVHLCRRPIATCHLEMADRQQRVSDVG
jgi:hypothetical protein